MEYLGYVFLGLPYVVAVILGLLIPVILFLSCRHVGFGIALVALLFTFQIFYANAEGLQLGVRLSVPDIVTVLIGLAALLRFLFVSGGRPNMPSWYLFLFAVFASLGLGLATLGSLAGVATRPYFYAIAVASYALTFPGDAKMVRQLMTALVWLALFLMAVIVARWVITYLPIPSLLPEGGRFSSVEASLLRVVSSEEAVVMAQVVVVALFYAVLSPALRFVRPLLPFMLMVVVALQHRSVWLATLAAVVARFALPQAGRKATVQLAALALVVAVVAIPVALSGKFGGAAQDISSSADRAVNLSDTADFRLSGWKVIISKWANSGPRGLAMGLPMGTAMDRTLLGGRGDYIRVGFQAHNYYVQTLFNTGLLGLGATLLVYGGVLLSLYRGLGDAELSNESGAMLLLIVAQMAYYFTYGIDFAQGLILGVAGALALTLRARRRALAMQAAVAAPLQGKMAAHAAPLRRPGAIPRP